jgi:Fe-S cluster assembly protein SufD
VHLVHHAARVGRDARLKHVSVSFGGDVVRFSASVDYAGPGGQVEMLGIYFADAGQHLENRLFVDHSAPHTTSNVAYKGAMQGAGAHGVWVGDVLIRKVAEGITTFESNRNLLLTEGARADSVPNLEIQTGEIVGAGHASATGRFDDEQMFYLQSRGITEDQARRLVVRGFFADVIKRIGIPQIESRLLEAIEAELAATAS